jgi:malonyl-CoA/methylmalonyl-CoA synthetase
MPLLESGSEPDNANLFAQIMCAVDDSNRIAVETTDGAVLSYADIFALSGRIANVLLAGGVNPGDRVAAKVEKTLPAMILYLSSLRVGAIYLPLNTAYTAAEVKYFLEDARPSFIVCDPAEYPEMKALGASLGASVACLDSSGEGSLAVAAENKSDAFETVQRAPNDLAAILYTSGTTGRSKGAMLTHENLASNALTLKQIWHFRSDDVLLHALPIYHTHGLFVAINVTLLSRAKLVLLPRFDANQIVRLMPRATVMMGVPTFYTRLLQHPALGKDLTKGIRLFVSGSAPLLADTHRAWQAATGHAILERYGMTETNMIASNPYNGNRVAGSVGLPLPGVSVRITDPETGATLQQDEIGMIEVRGPNVFSGYWQMPEKTASEFRSDGFFITGDLGKLDDDGYLHIVGRGKDLIISGGFNVYPKEVEVEIVAIAGVLESAVIGVPHADFGEGVAAVVVRRADAAIEEGDIISRLETRLAKFKLPKRVIFTSTLPRNAMGKVQKNVLRERYAGLFEASAKTPVPNGTFIST